ncbi:MAG: LPS export ABC transporter periplasmic protein LptC, partial [Dolichospermum sp.]
MQYPQNRENGREKSKCQRGNKYYFYFPYFYSFSQFRLATNWLGLSLSLFLGLWLSACGNHSTP